MNDDRDWFGVLGTALLEEAAATPLIDVDDFDVDAFVAEVLAGNVDAPAGTLVRRRRWKRYGAIGAILVVTAGGAVAATQLGNEKRPAAHAYEGAACLPEPRWATPMAVMQPSVDPIGDCRQQWLLGTMSNGLEGGPPLAVAPDLFACVSPTEIIAVFPRPVRSNLTCADIGLDEVDLSDLADNPYLKLIDGLSEITKRCLPRDQATLEAQELLDDLGLEGWTFREGNPGEVPTAAQVCTMLTLFGDEQISVRMTEPH